MAVPYNTIEVIVDQPDLPPWSTYWPGLDGCSPRHVYYGASIGFTNPPAGSTDSYEPEIVRISRSTKSVKGIRRGYPPFYFTPYHVTKTTTRQHLVKRRDGESGRDVYYQYGQVSKNGGSTCAASITRVEHTGPLHSIFDRVSHDYSGYTEYITHGFDESDVTNAISSVQAQVTQDALTSYDALTDIAELREVPAMLASMSRDILSILRGMRGHFGRNAMRACANTPIRELLRHPSRVFKKLGEEWMTYRYGIMPILYSCRDIMKTLDRGSSVETRNSEVVVPRDLNVSLPGPDSTYRRTRAEGDIVIRGCIFQHFSSQEMSRLSGLGINPFVTAWELIPYSFVVDWFINAGDYIAAKTTNTWAQKKWACLSRRSKYTTWTEVHLPRDVNTCNMVYTIPIGWLGTPPANPPPVVFDNPEGYFPIYSVEVDGYSRWLFDVGDAQLRFKPTLNWRRLVDSAVLSLNFLKSFMRFL